MFDNITSNTAVIFVWYSVMIVLAGFLASRFVSVVERLAVKTYITGNNQSETGWAVTLFHAGSWVAHIIVWVYVVLTIGSKMGLPTSLVSSVGALIGAGIGFGSQEIFRDIFKGSVHLAEHTFAVGDVVTVAVAGDKYTGTVERVSMRHIVLRTENNRTVVPQGLISVVENYSNGLGGFRVTLPFQPKTDISRVGEIIDNVIADITSGIVEKGYSEALTEKDIKGIKSIVEISTQGVIDVSDGIEIGVAGQTTPGGQFEAKRSVMKLLTEVLLNEGFPLKEKRVDVK